MKIANAYDEILAVATMGGLPTADDVAAVEVPPGQDPQKFAAEVNKTAAAIVELRKAGRNGDAKALAKTAAQDYLDALNGASAVKPLTNPNTDPAATPAEIAARPKHLQGKPDATPSELAARVTSGNYQR